MDPYHTHLRDRVEDIRRGVAQASGFPIVLPALSLSEPFVVPSTMLYRDPLATECEELMRPQPIDGAVVMGGRDKTTSGVPIERPRWACPKSTDNSHPS